MNIFKKTFFILPLFLLIGCSSITPEILSQTSKTEFLGSHPMVEEARKQIGVVTSYDTGYYSEGYPPETTGACSDVLWRALDPLGYDIKAKIDEDMKLHPERYPQKSDPNINFRRVRNIKIFLDHNAKSLPTCTDPNCFEESDWKAGDIVTYEQIPGGLWHVAIISNQVTKHPENKNIQIPYLIHNHGRGTVENNLLLNWPAPISGHYRLDIE